MITLIGNRPEWVLTMVACFRLGAVVLPCTEQLRAKDLRLRLEATSPVLVVADERNRAELKAAGPSCEVLLVPDPALWGDAVAEAPAVELAEDDPCLITFTSTNYFARLERGGINPTWDTVRRVADALDQTVSELAHAAEEIERKPRRADDG